MIEAVERLPLELKCLFWEGWNDERGKNDSQWLQHEFTCTEPFDEPRHFPDDRVVKMITQLIPILRHFV